MALHTATANVAFRCLWKGKTCEEDSIKPRLTDMGECFTYHSSDMFVEMSGESITLSFWV